jgi:hypothetical protein
LKEKINFLVIFKGDAAQDAIVEQERVDAYVSDKQRLWNEQQEKARVRGDNALKREVLDNVKLIFFVQ